MGPAGTEQPSRALRRAHAALRIAKMREQGRLLLAMMEAATDRAERRRLALQAFEYAQRAEVLAEEAMERKPMSLALLGVPQRSLAEV